MNKTDIPLLPAAPILFLSTSDVSAAIVGAGFSSIYGNSTPGMQAIKSLVISIIARLLSTSAMISKSAVSLDDGQKDQIVVGVLSAIESYFWKPKQSVFKGVISGISIDLVAQEVLKLIRLPDSSIIGGAAAPAAAP
jgi:hypothetical protein